MAELVRDYLALPDRTALDRFIVKDNSDPVELARTYVFTPSVTHELERLLGTVADLLSRRQEWQSLGRWLYGSFGSGKSHFLRILDMLLSRDPKLYEYNRDPALLQLQGKFRFLVESKILTVRVTMMQADASSHLTFELARAFDDRLTALGESPAHVFDYDKLFATFDQYCSRATSILDEFLDLKDYDRTIFAELRAGDFAERRALAQECAVFMYGNSETRFEPSPLEARTQMAAHASGLGYHAIVFLIDEFVLWAQSLPGEDYIGAVNELTALVDAERQPIPFIAIAAIQRSITERFPDDHSEDSLRRSLSHTTARFQTIELKDKEIFAVAQQRVLKVRPERKAEWEKAVAEIARSYAAARGVLIGNDAPETLAQLYPFHPALLHVLSDVSQGLQRERTSLYMLFQLLVEIRPDLEMGQLVSLGSLWEALFSTDNVGMLRQLVNQRGTNDAAHQLIKTHDAWQRLEDPIRDATPDGDKQHILALLVKSILLCQLSDTRFFGNDRTLAQSITIENLFRLNRAEVDVPIETLGARTVASLLSRLAEVAPSIVKLSGKLPTDTVSIALDTVDIRAMVDGLRPTGAERFAILAKYVKAVLDLNSQLRDDHLDAAYPVTWRSTTRKGRVRLERLELLAGRSDENDFAAQPSEAFRILVLMDVADPSTAIDRIVTARAYSQQWTAVVVPGVLSQAGSDALETLTRLETVFPRDRDRALGSFKMALHPVIERQVSASRIVAEQRLREELGSAYARDVQLLTLRTSTPELFLSAQRDAGRIIGQAAAQMLDLRFPQHPKFTESPRRSNLDALVSIVNRSVIENGRIALEPAENLTVERLGVPLELFDHGQLVASLRPTGLYMALVRNEVDDGKIGVTELRKSLETTFGMQNDVADAMIAAFAMQADYRVSDGTAAHVVSSLASIDTRGRLVRGISIDEATWIAGRSNALALFDLTTLPSNRSPQSVEALTKAFHLKAVASSGDIAKVCDELGHIRGKGLFTNGSAALDAYSLALRKLNALPNGEGLIASLADFDESTRKQLRSAIDCAADDAGACRKLLQNRLIDTVSVQLRDELQRTLETVKPPMAGALDAWSTKADNWIRDELAKKSVRPAASVEDGLGNGQVPNGTSTGHESDNTWDAGRGADDAARNGPIIVAPAPTTSNNRFVIVSENELETMLVNLRKLVVERIARDGSVTIDVAVNGFSASGVE